MPASRPRHATGVQLVRQTPQAGVRVGIGGKEPTDGSNLAASSEATNVVRQDQAC
jgi:hypothetical protein